MATEANSGAANLIPPVKGEVRNPNGRPKGIPNSKTRLLRLLVLTEQLKNPVTGEVEGFTVMEQLDMQQIIKARKGDTKAYQLLVERLEGKPQQTVEFTTNPIEEILKKYDLGGEDAREAEEAKS